jgi:hypothetical protein
MTKLFANASPSNGFRELDRIASPTSIESSRNISDLLSDSSLGPECVASWLDRLDPPDVELVLTRSIERSSHFKWFLGACSNGISVWLHEYKLLKSRGSVGSFAASIHNHRYSFGSRILKGEMHVTYFDFDTNQATLQAKENRIFNGGSTYWMSSDQIHRIDETGDGTCTVVVQTPPERPFSRVFDPAGRGFEDIYDLQSRLPRLICTLSPSTSS